MLHYMADYVPILGEVVDTVPYSKFQLLRAPWAAKLNKDMRLMRETMFTPPAIPLYGDPNTIYAGYTKAEYRRKLPLAVPFTLTVRRHRGGFTVSPTDFHSLYLRRFEQPHRNRAFTLDTEPVKRLREMLALLHPDRASHWYSWFRICGAMYSIYQDNTPISACRGDFSTRTIPTSRCSSGVDDEVLEDYNEILETFLHWSGQYEFFNRKENLQMIFRRSRVPRAHGWRLLQRLALYDNPNMKVHNIEME